MPKNYPVNKRTNERDSSPLPVKLLARILQQPVSRRITLFWIALLSIAILGTLAACQRAEEESTAIVQVPATLVGSPAPSVAYPDPATSYPVPATSYPDPASSYPDPATPTSIIPDDYPSPPTPTATPTPSITPSRPSAVVTGLPVAVYLPFFFIPEEPTPIPTSIPEPTPTPTIDFAVVRSQLEAEGQDLGFSKIGFHTGVGGNRVGLGEWMRRLDAAGVPFFIKTADDSGPLVEAQEILRNSSVPHTLVYRRSGDEYDIPDYDLPPEEAARRHWQLHMEAFPPELDPSLIWLETINEVDKERSEWLGRFAIETANLAMANGFRWAAFGWSSGEPEVTDWQIPSMQAFLRLAAANPDRVAIALHEYSFLIDDISDAYPFKVGRFQQLYEVTDQMGIARPTVLITEWGWEYQNVPGRGKAIQDINWAAAMYARYPEIKGAAIWYLGNGFGGIANETQPLIEPVTEFSLGTYFGIPMPPDHSPIVPEQFRP